jgi:hypothetical protein
MTHMISDLPSIRNDGIELEHVTPSNAETVRYASGPDAGMPGANDLDCGPLHATRSIEACESACGAQATIPEKVRNGDGLSVTVPRFAAAPKAPLIGSALLADAPVTFLEFLSDDDCVGYCRALFGDESTAGGIMLAEFRNGTAFHYYGHRRSKPGRQKPDNPGKLNASNTTSKKALKAFVRRAYRGDPDRRGVAFWQRVAGHIFDAYAGLNALRRQAEKIKRQEMARIARLPAKRSKGAARARRHRDKERAARQLDEAPSEVGTSTNGSPMMSCQ